jgi:hypothetical protein
MIGRFFLMALFIGWVRGAIADDKASDGPARYRASHGAVPLAWVRKHPAEAGEELPFSVDPSITGLVIEARADLPKLTLQVIPAVGAPLDPAWDTSDPMQPVQFNDGDRRIILIPRPAPGVWKVKVKGVGLVSLLIKAQTSVVLLSLEWMRKTGQAGDFPYHGPLRPGDREQLQFGLSGTVPRSLRVQLITTFGEVKETGEPRRSADLEFGLKMRIPNDAFHVLVLGKDEHGKPFQRFWIPGDEAAP